VGLGFGLQEVVANFVCGLILLLERPIRVGDVVTVEGTTGTVTRIRMRATTITNWDRKELVVPNKTLITSTLLNWTLSASITRVVIPVGVAYGSDTEKARRILLDTAADHPLVLDDPAPMAAFEGFADSTLSLSLRAYLPCPDNRTRTITDLHAEIDKRFAAAGIEIAFPQLDLHIRGGGGGTGNGGK
jgi:potassium efflux system protein